MNIRTQILVAAVAIVALIYLINSIRKYKVKLQYTLTWFLLAFGILLFGCFPSLTDAVSNFFGVSTPVNILFFVGFVFLLVMIFSLTKTISYLSGEVKVLVQETAILRHKCEELEKERGQNSKE